jgi:hypothetical protein
MQKEGTKPKWRSTNNKGNRTHKQQYNKRETKKEQIVYLLTARCHTWELS